MVLVFTCPESDPIAVSTAIIPHESNVTWDVRLERFEFVRIRFPERLFIAPERAFCAREFVK